MKIRNVQHLVGTVAFIANILSFSDATEDRETPTCDPRSVQKSYEDQCEQFCQDFFRLCVNPGFYSPGHKGWKHCNRSCLRYPRPDHSIQGTDVSLFHDTFYCRETQLKLAEWAPADAAYYCQLATPDGGGVCTDALIDGKTPYTTMSDGKCTHHRFAYCDLSAYDTVADCTNAGISDTSLGDALKLLPPSVKILFLTNNEEIKEILKDPKIFENLQSPKTLKALYLDNCGIEEVHPDVFDPLYNLEILSLSLNYITYLPGILFAGDTHNIDGPNSAYENGPLKDMKAFYIFGSSERLPTLSEKKVGRLTSIAGGVNETILPDDLFLDTADIETIVISGHAGYRNVTTNQQVQGIEVLPDHFLNKLFSLQLLYIGWNGLVNTGFPDGLFNDLESLKYFDALGNSLVEVEKDWFGKWAAHIVRVALQYNMIGSLTNENTFECMFELLHLYLHENPLISVPSDLFDQNKKLLTFTL